LDGKPLLGLLDSGFVITLVLERITKKVRGLLIKRNMDYIAAANSTSIQLIRTVMLPLIIIIIHEYCYGGAVALLLQDHLTLLLSRFAD